ncbi:MAG TPA: TIGR04086 family membrane protein [Clostridiaceae bacterium]|nr:TIGR04086 family membrane protein [Clostridiaceae bacterium]
MSRQEKAQSAQGGINLLVIGKAILISYIITIPAFIIFALILANTEFPHKYISPVVVITTIMSILIAGSMVSKNAKSRGWLYGALVGFIYMFVLYILSSIIFRDFSIDRYVLTMTAIGVLTGTIGGIMGINVKRGSRSKVKYKR